jgi:RNA polymerase sigma factor (sigma-70 family)
MVTSWKKRLHAQLIQMLMNEGYREHFNALRVQSVPLRKHPSPQALLAVLQNRETVSYQEKDEILHGLIVAFQSSPGGRSVALPLLLLAMWPALDHCEYKLIHFTGKISDLFSEVYWAYVEELERFSPEKLTKIAVNLQMNVEKRVRRATKEETRLRQWSTAATILEPEFNDLLADFGRERVTRLRELLETIPADIMRKAKKPNTTERRNDLSQPDKDVLRETLRNALPADLLTPEDQSLLVRHAIEGQSWAEIGAAMELSEGAARVRYFRIKAKLRPFLEPSDRPVTP